MGKLSFFKTSETCGYIDFSLGYVHCKSKEEQVVNLTSTILCPKRSPSMDRTIIAGVEKDLLSWLEQKKLPVTQSVIDARFSFIFPTCLREFGSRHLLTASQFIAWLFIFDDVLDKHAKALDLNADNMAIVFDTLTKIVRNELHSAGITAIIKNNPNIKLPLFEQFCHALHETCTSLRTITQENGASLDYFIKKFSRYMDSLKAELEERDQKYNVQTEEEYRRMRKNDGAVPTTFAFLAALKGIDIKEELFKKQCFKNMAAAGAVALSYVNDVVSFPKECYEPEHSSILWILLNQMQGDFEKAFKYAITLINDVTLTLLNPTLPLKDQLEPFKQFYELVCDCQYDNARWSIEETGRYRQFKDENNQLISMPFSMKYYEGPSPKPSEKITVQICPVASPPTLSAKL